MIQIRKSEKRGHTVIDWLDSRHTFSFDEYHDPEQMGFRSLQVINEDIVAPGKGFQPHSHRDMEILTVVLEGALEHRDSLGNGSPIRPDEVQRMTAGTGVTHSEFNASKTEPVHLLQIWILPEKKGLPPGYEQKIFPKKKREGKLYLIASGCAGDEVIKVHQDVSIYSSLLKAGQEISHALSRSRYAWLQVASGALDLNENQLAAGDGAAATHEPSLEIKAFQDSEFLLFDLA